ncbi:Hypothetical predicted protein [Paramuricea clavata]|nr:Hypothetical predicted protein [Paramuricea clavata]
MPESDLPYTLKSVDEVKPHQSSSSKDDSGLNIPVVAGGIMAVVVLIGLVFAICLYTRRRHKNNSTVPPVQFNSAGGGRMQIGQHNPAQLSNHYYEDPEKIRNDIHRGFTDHVYDDVHNPPPYYESSPVHKPAVYETRPPHVYEIPDEKHGDQAWPAKDKMPAGAVVYLIPSKDAAREKPVEADFNMKFGHIKRSQPNAYVVRDYEVPINIPGVQRPANPHDESELKLKPPPKSDDIKLQVMQEKTASSILPNVPRRKKINRLDSNPNEAMGSERASRSHYQNVGYVTNEQSET